MSSHLSTLKIGTRGSQLALVQANLVAEILRDAVGGLNVELVVIQTSGDWKPEQGETRLSAAKGGKGQFAKEIEQALLSGAVDLGVHSAKDMESHLHAGLMMRHFLTREDPRDAFISVQYQSLEEMPEGAMVGTSSVRRQAYVLNKRPDLKVVPLRGNVPTRLEKLRAGQVDATFLAVAGLNRLGLAQEITGVMSVEQMVPGAGQGAIGLEILKDNKAVAAILDKIICAETTACVLAERAALAVLDGSCHTPVGAYAKIEAGQLRLNVEVMSLDGTRAWRREIKGLAADAEALGQKLGAVLKAELPDGCLC